MRALILGLVIVAAAAALLFYGEPGGARLGNEDVPRLIYLLLALLLVSAARSASTGRARPRADQAR